MVVRLNRVVEGQLDAILAEDLAVRKIGVGGSALLGQRSGGVEEIHDVDVHSGELGRLDAHVIEETTGLVHGGDVSTADPVAAISWLKSSILPAVNLGHGHHILNTHILLGSNLGDLRDILVFDSEAFVKSARVEVLSEFGVNVLNNLEHDRDELTGEQRRPVVISGVNPAVKEVMVAIRKAYSVIEEVIGCFFIELGTSLSIQGVVSHVEAGILSLLDPVGPLGSLKAVSWPVPSILGLNDVKLSIKAEGHDVMADP